MDFFVDRLNSNHMAFIAEGEEYRFFVNGTEVPLEVDAEDRKAIESVVGTLRYVSDGTWYGGYGSFGSANVTIRERDFNGPFLHDPATDPARLCARVKEETMDEATSAYIAGLR